MVAVLRAMGIVAAAKNKAEERSPLTTLRDPIVVSVDHEAGEQFKWCCC